VWAGRREKRSNWDWVRGPKMGQLTLSMEPVRAKVPSYIQRATIPSKRVLDTLIFIKYHTCDNF
jgi:hypothetical protein